MKICHQPSALLVGVLLQMQLSAIAANRFITYEDARRSVIQAEDSLTTGGRIHLSTRELRVEDIFMRHKLSELARGFHDPNLNAAGMHFFKALPLIDKSSIFKFIRKMPKGGVLHLHNSASVSSEWVVRNISYMPGLLRCTNSEGVNILTFRYAPDLHGCRSKYVSVNEERLRSISLLAYDRSFERLINLYTPTPELDYGNINQVWTKFQNMFTTMNDVYRYLPAYRFYHRRMLEEMYEDNIMYAEVRMDFKELYDENGHVYPPEYSIEELLRINRDFCRQYPGFLGIKVIIATHRGADHVKVRDKFNEFKRIHLQYPAFVIGFDLVGQEDRGQPLFTFLNSLTDLPRTARFFFHAGETNWYGASADYNLLDALLLNTTRIGHGFALMKHPLLLNAVKGRGVAVEVSPISNQVLHLVWDLRNHPGGFYISQDIPMVICNDDPGFWNTRGLSYDFYYAIMSLAPNNAGLKTLKSLAWNSIKYSSLLGEQRRVAWANLERAWEHFIDDVLQDRVL